MVADIDMSYPCILAFQMWLIYLRLFTHGWSCVFAFCAMVSFAECGSKIVLLIYDILIVFTTFWFNVYQNPKCLGSVIVQRAVNVNMKAKLSDYLGLSNVLQLVLQLHEYVLQYKS